MVPTGKIPKVHFTGSIPFSTSFMVPSPPAATIV